MSTEDDPLAKYRIANREKNSNNHNASSVTPSNITTSTHASKDSNQLRRELTNSYLLPKQAPSDDAFAKYRVGDNTQTPVDVNSLTKQLSTTSMLKKDEGEDGFSKYKISQSEKIITDAAVLKKELTQSCNLGRRKEEDHDELAKYRISKPTQQADITVLKKELSTAHVLKKTKEGRDEGPEGLSKYKVNPNDIHSNKSEKDAATLKREITRSCNLGRRKEDEEEWVAKYRIKGASAESKTPSAALHELTSLKKDISSANVLKKKDEQKQHEESEALSKYRIPPSQSTSLGDSQHQPKLTGPGFRSEMHFHRMQGAPKPAPIGGDSNSHDAAKLQRELAAAQSAVFFRPEKGGESDYMSKYLIKADSLAVPDQAHRRSVSAEEVDPFAKYRIPQNQTASSAEGGGRSPTRVKSGEWSVGAGGGGGGEGFNTDFKKQLSMARNLK